MLLRLVGPLIYSFIQQVPFKYLLGFLPGTIIYVKEQGQGRRSQQQMAWQLQGKERGIRKTVAPLIL